MNMGTTTQQANPAKWQRIRRAQHRDKIRAGRVNTKMLEHRRRIAGKYRVGLRIGLRPRLSCGRGARLSACLRAWRSDNGIRRRGCGGAVVLTQLRAGEYRCRKMNDGAAIAPGGLPGPGCYRHPVSDKT